LRGANYKKTSIVSGVYERVERVFPDTTCIQARRFAGKERDQTMKYSLIWTILAAVFGFSLIVDLLVLFSPHGNMAIVLAHGAWFVICTIQVERYKEKEAAAEAANRDQTPPVQN
jgi:hypothetical protein